MTERCIPAQPATTLPEPLNDFSRCHMGIISQLQAAGELPALAEAAARALRIAQGTLQLFQKAVVPHHREEEDELFPAVLRSAFPGTEYNRVKALVDQLTAEHRDIEARWKALESQVKEAARGHFGPLDERAMNELVTLYLQHARMEEAEFLPLAEQILGRNDNHMAALGLSLHMRHTPEVIGHI